MAIAVIGSLPPPVRAQDSTEAGDIVSQVARHTTLSGSLRGAYWSSSRSLDDRENLAVGALWLHAASQLAPAVSLSLDGWVRNDDLFQADATSGKFREGYLDLGVGPIDLRIGKQIIAWGRADSINPTDNLTPTDLTLLVPEDTDRRSGTTGIVASYHRGGVSVTGVWLPTFEPDVIPIQRPPPPFILREREPSDPVSQWALKVERTGGRADWSISYYDGFDLRPDLEISDVGLSGITLALTHHRIRVIGADVAATWGPYGLRGEAAYTFTEHSGTRLQVKSPFFFLVVGGDRTFPGNLNVNLQYILRVITDYRSPVDVADPVERAVATEQALINAQLDQSQHSISLRVGKKWLNDTLEGEVAAVVSLTRLDYVLRPKITYAVTDRLKVTVGADVFRGAVRSFFGRLRDTSTAYAELRWDF